MSAVTPHQSMRHRDHSMGENYDESWGTKCLPFSPQDIPITSPRITSSFNRLAIASPATMNHPHLMGSYSFANNHLENDPSGAYESYMPLPVPMATPPASEQEAYITSSLVDSISSYKSDNATSGGIPLFQPRPIYYNNPSCSWNLPTYPGAHLGSSSPLSLSSSSQGSSSTSLRGDLFSISGSPSSCYHSFQASSSPASLSSPQLIGSTENQQENLEQGMEITDGDITEEDEPDQYCTHQYWQAESNSRSTRRKRPTASSNINEFASQSEKRAPYAVLIYQALMSAPGRKMVLADIYSYFRRELPFFKSAKGRGWTNSIRHNLSMNGAFLKESRPPGDKGKGCIWVLSEEAQKNGITSTTRYRRNAPRPAKRNGPTRRTRKSTRSAIKNRIPSPPPPTPPRQLSSTIPILQPTLPEPNIEYGDYEVGTNAPQTPPTPPESPGFGEANRSPRSVPSSAGSGVFMHTTTVVVGADAAANAKGKAEEPISPFDTAHHSPQPHQLPPPPGDLFENTIFGQDELYIRQNEDAPWLAVPYTSSFAEQYNLVAEAAAARLEFS